MPKPQSKQLGVVGMGDAMTPAHGIATPPYVERKVAEAQAITFAALVKTRIATMLLAGGLSGITLAGVAYAYEKLETKATLAGTAGAQLVTTAIDAGLKGVEARTTVLEQQRQADRAETNTRLQRVEDGQLRTDRKLDALLDRLDVKNPAPTPKDAGR